VGFWKDNKKDGEGTLYFKDGSKFKGQFMNNLRQGIGKFVD
jgi:antitoxin component YwqK of YwqJK toxin-antitoxin module